MRTTIRIAAAIGLVLSFQACETAKDDGKRFGDPCTHDGDCVTDLCYEGTCAKRGATCVAGTAVTQCDDADACTIDACEPTGTCLHRLDATKAECVVHGDVTACTCADAGVTIDPGTCTWPDAAQCSGWHSVAVQNGNTETTEFPSGTELCAFGCCLTIRCP